MKKRNWSGMPAELRERMEILWRTSGLTKDQLIDAIVRAGIDTVEREVAGKSPTVLESLRSGVEMAQKIAKLGEDLRAEMPHHVEKVKSGLRELSEVIVRRR